MLKNRFKIAKNRIKIAQKSLFRGLMTTFGMFNGSKSLNVEQVQMVNVWAFVIQNWVIEAKSWDRVLRANSLF